ncbi:gas vesicle protein GvpG [Patescibacteria group bacterium]|nr:gas vesicle protein GvpG [Patescibacteria group bacterium]
MNFTLLDLVFPLTLPLKGLFFIAERLKETAEGEITDEPKVYEELLELQMKFEMDEITEEEYEKGEKKLMQRLEAIRKHKEEL